MLTDDGSVSVPISTRKVDGYPWTENWHHFKLEDFNSKDSKELCSPLKLNTKLSCKNLKGTLPQNLNSVMQILTDKLF